MASRIKNQNGLTLYQEVFFNFKSLIRQSVTILVGGILFLLLTDGQPSRFATIIAISLGLLWIVKDEYKRYNREHSQYNPETTNLVNTLLAEISKEYKDYFNLNDMHGGLFYNIDSSRWEIALKHKLASYTLILILHDDWISLTAPLMKVVSGERYGDFYELALELNSDLNGVYVGIESNMLILIRKDFIVNMNKDNLYRNLKKFNDSHEYVTKNLFTEAERLNLRFKY